VAHPAVTQPAPQPTVPQQQKAGAHPMHLPFSFGQRSSVQKSKKRIKKLAKAAVQL
jgi:hypothetical protein